ncbi:hypothetical protein [Reyranella sp.]|uniref:hypothetical protein n=1 Tax=Reyranella sp. TaxID=1929291 RepID=UPI00272F0339|nr:hypothetical protein [Reyranella sp.]MDP2372208.1 hypothetical protein [Reyranella sp.]
MAKASDLLEQAAARRDLARRARRLAESLSPEDRERLRAHAEELEGEATELEGQAAYMADKVPPASIVSGATHQVQQQQQQQQHTEPKVADPADPKRRP